MRIAIETDDGVSLSSKRSASKNFQIYEVTENSFLKNLGTEKSLIKEVNNMPFDSLVQDESIMNELSKCSTVISQGMDSSLLNNLKRSNVDVFISFRVNIDEALNNYLKDRIIHNFYSGN